MGTYSVGNVTKERILETCKLLYYEKGIRNTSYDDICAAANINRGLVPYHFKSKSNIAGLIMTEFAGDFENLVLRHAAQLSANARFALHTILLFRLIDSDKQLQRFFFEFETSGSQEQHSRLLQQGYISRITTDNAIPYTDDEIRTLTCMFVGVEKEIIHNLYNGYLTENIDDIIHKDVLFVFGILGFERRTVEDLFNVALNYANNIEVTLDGKFRPGFEAMHSRITRDGHTGNTNQSCYKAR